MTRERSHPDSSTRPAGCERPRREVRPRADPGRSDAILTDDAGWQVITKPSRRTDRGARKVTASSSKHPAPCSGSSPRRLRTTSGAGADRVTGTNGKTTTTYWPTDARGSHRTRHRPVAILIAGDTLPSVRTTPEAPELHALFAKMRTAEVDTCSMEVSSHALSQHRVDGAHFNVAGFTNLSQDHLDFHNTMEEYFEAKAQLFTRTFSDKAVIVIEDEWGERMTEAAQVPVRTLGRDDRSQWRIEHTPGEADFVLHLDDGQSIRLRSPLPGDFNVTNTALAASMLIESGIPAAEIDAIGRSFVATVPGRMEIIDVRTAGTRGIAP